MKRCTYICVCTYTQVCVCERQRQRERECVCRYIRNNNERVCACRYMHNKSPHTLSLSRTHRHTSFSKVTVSRRVKSRARRHKFPVRASRQATGRISASKENNEALSPTNERVRGARKCQFVH